MTSQFSYKEQASCNTILTLTTKVSKGKEYLYYQAGNNSMYICSKDNPNKARQENVIKTLEHARIRADHYLNATDDLLPMLSEPLRKKYTTSKRDAKHYKMC